MRVLLLIVLVILLSGCETMAGFDDDWLAQCTQLPPPDKETYRNSTPDEKVLLWADLYVRQAGVMKKCNARIAEAEAFVSKVKKGEL